VFWALPGPGNVARPKLRLKEAPVSADGITLFPSETQLFAPLIARMFLPSSLASGSIVAVPCQVRLSVFQAPFTVWKPASLGPRKLTVGLTVGSISRSAVSVTVSVPFPNFPFEPFVLSLEKAIVPPPSKKDGGSCGSGLLMVTGPEYWVLVMGGGCPHQSFVAVAATVALKSFPAELLPKRLLYVTVVVAAPFDEMPPPLSWMEAQSTCALPVPVVVTAYPVSPVM